MQGDGPESGRFNGIGEKLEIHDIAHERRNILSIKS
jgi:hypothetical protein